MNKKVGQILPYLQELDLGEDVAEHEQGLNSYFVLTGSYFSLMHDEADVILGPKGSGKSALSRYLVNGDHARYGLTNTDIIPAFNSQGSVIFQRFESLSELGEAGARSLWTTYLTSLVANHLVDNYNVKPEARSLDRLLKDTGLRLSSSEPKSVWVSITDRLRQILRASSVEGSLTFSPDGTPLISGRVNLAAKQKDAWPSAHQLDDMLQTSASLLAKLGRRCWVVLDRLDEAFQYDPETERLALRSLLRAHLDLVSYGQEIRSKLFLRTELLDRITNTDGFVNASHLRIDRINWSSADVLHMLTLRILNNPELCASFGLLDLDPSSENARIRVCSVVLPGGIEGEGVLGWLIKRTVDGSSAINPRNIITLLRAARAQQLRWCERDNLSISEFGALIGPGAMRVAYRELSKLRLSDTLLAEFPNVRPYVDKLRGRTVKWSRASILCRELGLDESNTEVIDELIYAGLIMRTQGGSFSIPFLYRPALVLPQAHAPRWDSAQRSSRVPDDVNSGENAESASSPASLIEPIATPRRRLGTRRGRGGKAEGP